MGVSGSCHKLWEPIIEPPRINIRIMSTLKKGPLIHGNPYIGFRVQVFVSASTSRACRARLTTSAVDFRV